MFIKIINFVSSHAFKPRSKILHFIMALSSLLLNGINNSFICHKSVESDDGVEGRKGDSLGNY